MNRKIILITTIIIFITFASILSSCQISSRGTEKGEVIITNINIYKDTPAWELALAVKKQKVATIEKIGKENPELLNYQDPKYDATLLLWAVGMEKYKSAEALLEAGADPNIASSVLYGETPLFLATSYSWIDNDAKDDPKYVKLLLRYGADPNKHNTESEKYVLEPGACPLMNSISSGIGKTKALVEAGADINYKTKHGMTAAIIALRAGGPNATLDSMEYARYLIVEKKANVSAPYYRTESYGNEDPNEKLYPVNTLRRWIYDLGSEEYKIKMEIVEEFARQGVDYWETEIPKYTLGLIQKRYPDTWQDYIIKY